jgi:hypothetical protein
VTGCRRAHCQTPANPAAAAAAAAAIHPQLGRLRRICERRLCETVDVETVATTLALAEQNHAEELKRVCLDFVSRNLAQVRGGGGGRGAGGPGGNVSEGGCEGSRGEPPRWPPGCQAAAGGGRGGSARARPNAAWRPPQGGGPPSRRLARARDLSHAATADAAPVTRGRPREGPKSVRAPK